MNIDLDRSHCCCFTGHRPEKLSITEDEVKYNLIKAIETAVRDGYTNFITGMARGVDLWAAEIILSYQKAEPSLKLIAASPYKGTEKNWPYNWKYLYKTILKKANYIEYVNPQYSTDCYQKRNEWMVNHASRLIACYNGRAGGTRNTIRYAEKQQLQIITIPV